MKILVAEDNELNKAIIVRILKKLGVEADVASNGIEAVRETLQNSYDLILMDIQMPGMNGIDAAKEIISKLGANAPKIIALTANTRGDEERLYINAGMKSVISKPVSAGSLEKLLESYKTGEGSSFSDEDEDLLNYTIIDTYLSNGDEQDREFYSGMFQSYKESFIDYLTKIRSAIQESDSAEVKSLCHNLRGVSFNMGAAKIGNILNEFENEFSISSNENNTEFLSKLDKVFRETSAKIENEIKKVSKGD